MLDLTVGLAGVGGRETGLSGTSVWETESITWSLRYERNSNAVERRSCFWSPEADVTPQSIGRNRWQAPDSGSTRLALEYGL